MLILFCSLFADCSSLCAMCSSLCVTSYLLLFRFVVVCVLFVVCSLILCSLYVVIDPLVFANLHALFNICCVPWYLFFGY